MKKMSKRFLVVLFVLTVAFGLTACGGEDKSIQYDANTLAPAVEQFISATLPNYTVDAVKAGEMQMTDEEFEMNLAIAESWEKASEEIGMVQEVKEVTFTSDEKEIIARADVVGTTGKDAQVEIILDKRFQMKSCVVNVNRSFGELMTNAALNTLLGMGTVFVVLVLISFIISAFKLINVISDKKAKKAAAPSANEAAAEKAVAQIIETEEQSDDLELVAVISAAIAAYEEAQGGSGDGYVVRSIKRRY